MFAYVHINRHTKTHKDIHTDTQTQSSLEVFLFFKDKVLLHSPPASGPTCWDYNYVQTQLEAVFLTESATNTKGTKGYSTKCLLKQTTYLTNSKWESEQAEKLNFFLELGEHG